MIARDQLRAFVERIERLEEEIGAINGDKKEVYAEAKANGFDVKALKAVIAERRKDPAQLAEFDAILDIYRHALGMVPDEGRPVQAHARVENIEEFEPAAPKSRPEIAPLDRPATAKTVVKASLEPRDAGEVQDRSASTSPPITGDDLEIPSFLDRASPDCIVRRLQ